MIYVNEHQKLNDLMAQVSVNYDRTITEATAALFKMMKDRWGVDAVVSAVQSHMLDPDCGQFFPKIADVAKKIEGTSKQQDAAIEDRASIAWSCIELQIRRVGAYGSLQLDDRQALATVKAMGGWKDLCNTETAKMEWRRKEFIRLYETFERTPVEALPSNLPGLIELSEHKAKARDGMKSISDGVAKFRANQTKMIGGK